MNIWTKAASGRSKCVMCRESIKAGSVAVVASGYQSDGQAHLACVTKQAAERVPGAVA